MTGVRFITAAEYLARRNTTTNEEPTMERTPHPDCRIARPHLEHNVQVLAGPSAGAWVDCPGKGEPTARTQLVRVLGTVRDLDTDTTYLVRRVIRAATSGDAIREFQAAAYEAVSCGVRATALTAKRCLSEPAILADLVDTLVCDWTAAEPTDEAATDELVNLYDQALAMGRDDIAGWVGAFPDGTETLVRNLVRVRDHLDQEVRDQYERAPASI